MSAPTTASPPWAARGRLAAGLLLGVGALGLAVALAPRRAAVEATPPASEAPAISSGTDLEPTASFPSAADRAVGLGYLLDSPRPPEVIDRGLEIAEKLRRRYGIDTGNPQADRVEAARRAQAEILDRLEFDAKTIVAMATELGYSLDPADCGNACENIRELATLELKKRALEAFAEAPAAVAEE